MSPYRSGDGMEHEFISVMQNAVCLGLSQSCSLHSAHVLLHQGTNLGCNWASPGWRAAALDQASGKKLMGKGWAKLFPGLSGIHWLASLQLTRCGDRMLLPAYPGLVQCEPWEGRSVLNKQGWLTAQETRGDLQGQFLCFSEWEAKIASS